MIDHLTDNSERANKRPRLGGEDGIVLIVVLITMLLLSILGVTLLDGTTSELKITGNSRNNMIAFHAADSAILFAQVNSLIHTSLDGSTSSWPTDGGHVLNSSLASTGSTLTDGYNVITIPGTTTTVKVKVELIGPDSLPEGLGTQEESSVGGGTSSFRANYFIATAIANGPNNSVAQIESQFARIIQIQNKQ